MTFDPIKDPDAILDYCWDWTAWLQPSETIATVTWIVPTGLTQTDQDQGATTATIWLTGGIAGQSYAVTCRVTTNQGRTDDRTQTLRCRER